MGRGCGLTLSLRPGWKKQKQKKENNPRKASEWCSVATNPSNWGSDSVCRYMGFGGLIPLIGLRDLSLELKDA